MIEFVFFILPIVIPSGLNFDSQIPEPLFEKIW